jgi:DNA replication protein DnaC
MGELEKLKVEVPSYQGNESLVGIITEPNERCPLCKGTNYVRESIGKIEPCACWYGKGQKQSYERHSGLQSVQRDNTFLSFRQRQKISASDHKTLTDIVMYCKDYATSRTSMPWLILGGSMGWGKSHLAQAIVNERTADPELGVAGHFVKAQQVLQSLRDAYDHGSYTNVIRKYKESPLLVLDDLGATSNKRSDDEALSWVDEQMLTILDHRSNERMETVITLNVPLIRIEPRLRDRINDTGTGLCKIYAKELPSYRTGEIQN